MNDTLNRPGGASPALPESLGNLPGVDLESVLALIGGDRQLLGELLAAFVEEFGNIPEEACQALEQGDIAPLTRRLHALKGTAANLGLMELSQQAAALEQALKTGSPPSDPLASLITTYSTLLPAIAKPFGEQIAG